MPIQLAIPVSLVCASALHLLLQRRFVFVDRAMFALSASEQARRYVPIVATQYAVTAGATAVLPRLLDASEQLVYLGAVVVVSAVTFLFLRARVFHVAEDAASDQWEVGT